MHLHRKLLGQNEADGAAQWPRYNNQLAASRVSAAITKQAIRSAVDNPYPGNQFAATRGATQVGQATATLATTAPCYLTGCWSNGYYYYGRRR